MGKIKKLKDVELVGGTEQSDVYPITSTKAIYDENNERLDNILGGLWDKIGILKNAGYLYVGIATPTTDPGISKTKVFYIANGKGTYTNFGGLEVMEDEVALLKYDTAWTKEVTGIATADQLNQLGQYIEDDEFLKVVTDSEGKIAYGITKEGKFVFGEGCPEQITEYLEQGLIQKVDKELGKSLIDSGVASSQKTIDDDDFYELKIDSEGKILEGVTKYGHKRVDVPIDTPSINVSHIKFDEYLMVATDSEGKIVNALKKNGTAIYGGINLNELKEKVDSGDSIVKYAHNYGILPTNTAYQNAELMNALLQNGNIDVVFALPGTYKIGHSVKIGSNTRITCKEGVVFEREGTFFNVFINTGASTATYNERITLDGFYLNVPQEGLEQFDFDSPTMGLRGLIAFAFVRELTIKNLIIRSVDDFQYMVHINKAERVIIEHFDIRGEKDGIHVSSLYDFVIRDGVFQTTDDAIGLNVYDLYDNNLVGGNVKYGVIENISSIKRPTLRGCGIRMMVGAFVNWYDGMEVMDCEMVRGVSGRIYRVIALPGTGATKETFISHTSPTITTYSGKQADNGFYWKLVDDSPMMTYNADTGVTRVDVSDIVIRNFKVNQGAYVVMQDVWYDGYNNVFRTLHPDVLPGDYPHTDNIILENIVNHGSATPDLVDINPYVITDAKFVNIAGFMRRFILESGNAHKRVIFDNYDFSKVIPNSNIDIEAGEDSEIVIRDCKTTRGDGNLVISSLGSVKSNCSISALPGNPKKGDTLILDGVFKYYNGTQWV